MTIDVLREEAQKLVGTISPAARFRIEGRCRVIIRFDPLPLTRVERVLMSLGYSELERQDNTVKNAVHTTVKFGKTVNGLNVVAILGFITTDGNKPAKVRNLTLIISENRNA